MKKFAVLAAYILIVACGAEHNVGSTESDLGLGKGGTTNLRFSDIKENILKPNGCINCHGQYNNYLSVKSELDRILAEVETNNMPKDRAPLTENEKLALREWINAGAPEDVDQPPPIDILEPTWASISDKIIFPKCTQCHNQQGEASFLDLSSRQNIFNVRNRKYFGNNGEVKLIDFDNPDTSYLIQIIEDPEEPMPPSYTNLGRLSEEEVNVLKQWIILGLP